MKIFYIGCVQSSAILLRELIKYRDIIEIVGVITKSNSSINSDFEDLAPICRENHIDYKYVQHINELESIAYIRDKHPDIIYCFGWSQIIGKIILDIPPRGVIGFHPAKLPYNRGRHPIIWALVLGLEQTASTFFKMDQGADTGDILSQIDISITYEDDANSLYEKIMEIAKQQVKDFTYALVDNKEKLIRQPLLKTNNWRKRSIKDGEIDWRMSSKGIYNLVRALTKPYIGAHFVYNNQFIKVWKVKEIVDQTKQNLEYGKVIAVYSETHFLIKCGDNLIEVLECDPIILREGEYL